MGLIGFSIVFAVLMLPWFALPGAIAAGLSGAVAALFGYGIAHRQMDQARRFYEEARAREDRERQAGKAAPDFLEEMDIGRRHWSLRDERGENSSRQFD